MATFYTWTPVSKKSGKLISGNVGLFASREEAMEWASFKYQHETESGSDVFSPDGNVCERFRNKRVNYFLNIIRAD